MTLTEQELQNNLLSYFCIQVLAIDKFCLQGRDKHNFEFATAAEDALLSIAAA